MDRSIRYQMLQQEEDPTPSAVAPHPPIPPQGIPPPAYDASDDRDELVAADQGAANGPPQPSTSGASTSGAAQEAGVSPQDPSCLCKGSFPAPPPYSVAAAELPTYEEAQRVKLLEEEEAHRQQEVSGLYPCDDDILGTDLLFFTSFFVAFLFNWVGFLLLLCFCHTLAGRYGALAGFGLSLAKWTLIVKHSTDLVASENEWLWWLIMAFGILICARACLQYVNAKREWKLLNPIGQHDRLFLLY